MTQAIHLLVFCKVSIVYTSILILLTVLLTTTMLLVIRVLPLMMLVYSTAHTFHYRWFVLWERTPSSQKLDLRQDTVLLQTHLLKEPHRDLECYLLTKTDTTEEWLLKTLCKRDAYIFPKGALASSFFLCYHIRVLMLLNANDK